MTQAGKLSAGIAKMGLSVTMEAQQKLLDYITLLRKWNKVYNLTAVRDPTEMITLHLLDSISVMPYVKGSNLLDVGSGAGLPGIVLAICMPQLHVTTIDAVQKKAIFMRQVKGELGLNNLEVVNARVEDFLPPTKFDVIISRAFSEIALFIKTTRHLLAENGEWLAMKGAIPTQELQQKAFLALQVRVCKIIPLSVAGLDADRHLIILDQLTIEKY